MKFLNFLKIFLLVLFLNFVVSKTNYCSEDLCQGLQHIACNNSGLFADTCPEDKSLLNFTKSEINLILNQHNILRNKIASGNENRFKTASKMSTMIWNKELANLAELNAKTCKFQHDQCRNTKKFNYAGQNIAISQSSDNFIPINDLITSTIKNWYDEIENSKEEDIEAFKETEKPIGHFTQIINDLSNEIGCAAIHFTEDNWKSSLFVCNYARTNILGSPIYTVGDVASGCKTGTNKNYPSLCSTDETVNPN